METTEKSRAIKGGEFLIKETPAERVFIPEEWSEEQRMIAQTCRDFLETEIYPRLEEIDSMKNPELMPQLMDKAGELGLLGTSVPENYGGFGMDFNTSMLVAEVTGAGHSFAVALSAHTGIGTLPILYYGTKSKRLNTCLSWLLANTRQHTALPSQTAVPMPTAARPKQY